MTDAKTCPQCGCALSTEAAEGLCPACLLKAGMKTETNARRSTNAPKFTPPAPSELAGSFPQLELIELIGQGGMGAVYKAKQLHLDRFVALKVLPPDLGRTPGFAERFQREARALARLSHQNLVTIHDFGQSGDWFWILMEYIDGANLRQVLSTGSLSPQQALAIVPQLCEALQYAHDEGVVHRDIKPENILLDRKGRVKIADFGLAKLIGGAVEPAGKDALTATGDVIGTMHYMAPEQIEGGSTVDHRADIYSLGVVLYEMLTGSLPLGRFQAPSKSPSVDPRLDEVVFKTLEKDPQRRYQRAEQVKSDVDRIASGPGEAKKAEEEAPSDPLSDELWTIFSFFMLFCIFAVNFGAAAYVGAGLVVFYYLMIYRPARGPLRFNRKWFKKNFDMRVQVTRNPRREAADDSDKNHSPQTNTVIVAPAAAPLGERPRSILHALITGIFRLILWSILCATLVSGAVFGVMVWRKDVNFDRWMKNLGEELDREFGANGERGPMSPFISFTDLDGIEGKAASLKQYAQLYSVETTTVTTNTGGQAQVSRYDLILNDLISACAKIEPLSDEIHDAEYPIPNVRETKKLLRSINEKATELLALVARQQDDSYPRISETLSSMIISTRNLEPYAEWVGAIRPNTFQTLKRAMEGSTYDGKKLAIVREACGRFAFTNAQAEWIIGQFDQDQDEASDLLRPRIIDAEVFFVGANESEDEMPAPAMVEPPLEKPVSP